MAGVTDEEAEVGATGEDEDRLVRTTRHPEAVLDRFRDACRRLGRLRRAVHSGHFIGDETAARLLVTYDNTLHELEALFRQFPMRRPLRCDGMIVSARSSRRSIEVIDEDDCLDISRPLTPPAVAAAPEPGEIPF
jgi:hypothetical protein